MRVIALMVGAALAASAVTPAAALRITADPGGRIGPYLKALMAMRRSGEHIVIDGPCISACTMVLGVIPRERICVTRRAKLGFHAAWHPTRNGPVTSTAGTKLLWDIYPEDVRSWITRRGGLSRRLLVLSGRELTTMYRACGARDQVEASRRSSRPAARAKAPPRPAVTAIAR